MKNHFEKRLLYLSLYLHLSLLLFSINYLTLHVLGKAMFSNAEMPFQPSL